METRRWKPCVTLQNQGLFLNQEILDLLIIMLLWVIYEFIWISHNRLSSTPSSRFNRLSLFASSWPLITVHLRDSQATQMIATVTVQDFEEVCSIQHNTGEGNQTKPLPSVFQDQVDQPGRRCILKGSCFAIWFLIKCYVKNTPYYSPTVHCCSKLFHTLSETLSLFKARLTKSAVFSDRSEGPLCCDWSTAQWMLDISSPWVPCHFKHRL